MPDTRSAGFRGALPPRSPHPFRDLRNYLKEGEHSLPKPEGPFCYGSRLSYPMALNDRIGDCTIAGAVHAAQIFADITDTEYVLPSDDEIGSTYFGLTGGQDTGLELSTVISKWASSDGLLGSKLAGAATINIRDEELMAQALYNFGALYVAVNLPASAEIQFNAHLPWMLGGNPTIEGGHCVVLNGAESLRISQHRTVGDFRVVTWGADTAATDGWWQHYGTEAYVLIPQAFVDAGHDAVQHIDLAQMRADLQLLTQAA